MKGTLKCKNLSINSEKVKFFRPYSRNEKINVLLNSLDFRLRLVHQFRRTLEIK